MTPVDYRRQTTLITGTSSGIGAEFARQLAARGSALVLVARREDRLRAMAAELTAAHGVEVAVLPADLSLPDAGPALAAAAAERGLAVTSVINNAGLGNYGPFHTADPAQLTTMINVDLTALVGITRAFIGPLREAGNGVLVNVASLTAYLPMPSMAVYAAAKAFVLSFTESLWQESRGTGVRVLALSPGATSTEFFEVVGTDAADGGTPRQTPAEVVGVALRTLDRRNPPPSVISGGRNRLMVAASRRVPRRVVLAVSGAVAARNADRPAGGPAERAPST
ncbi:SDR family NAD(P)-dependent oxidoreductase [Actinoplanes sp. NPDC051346]|uniref:SDR family NAD(P)-dependent oxidoreductase n=1 Tax=Actinoplanes sp. NPDC051346 TaxID=3155048 RepID=UPI003438EAA3